MNVALNIDRNGRNCHELGGCEEMYVHVSGYILFDESFLVYRVTTCCPV
jgi:hypothetical protein